MAASRPALRRRQRSLRVTLSVTLLGVATLLVLAPIPSQSPFWMGLAASVGLALSWAALRTMWTEVLQSRRENAADRAAAARTCRGLFTVRAAEHAELTTAMTERLAEAHLCNRELEGLVAQVEGRAQRAESRLAEVQLRCQTLERTNAVQQPEDRRLVAELAEWDRQSTARPVDASPERRRA